jgi:RND superfamily putative drug exporter
MSFATGARPAGTRTADPRPGPIGLLGRACYRHRWVTLIAWLAGVACLIVLWTGFGAPAQDNYGGSDPGQALLDNHFPHSSGDRLTLAIDSTAPLSDAAVRARIEAALVPFTRAAHVTSVSDPYRTPGQISRDGHIAFAAVQFGVPATSISNGEAKALMRDATAASGHGIRYSLGGDVVDLAETAPSFSPIIAAMIGLGVGVDYALFIVTRFRDELRAAPGHGARGLAPGGTERPAVLAGAPGGTAAEAAAVTAMRTAGRTVLIAGMTVVIGMMGLLVLRQPLLNGVAVAAAATVAMVLLGSLTLLPALLGFTGTRLAKRSRLLARRRNRPATASRSEKIPAAQRWAAVIQRRPVLATVASTVVILALAAPALGMKLNFPDESAQARGTMGYASYATMVRGFGPGFDAPVIVAAALPAPGTSTAALASAIRATPGVAGLTPVVRSADGKAAMMIAYPTTGEQDTATNALVNRIRAGVLPHATAGTGIRAYLTGPNAGGVAFANLVGRRLPWLVAVVVLVSMLLLTVMFRSVTIAVKAAVMNLLSISAAYGVLVGVVQDGWLRQVFGFPENMPVTTWVPMFLFVILFGLSMDYEVFLLSRIRESYDATGDNAGSVASGLARTARVITAAAAIMVVVFLSFVLGPNVSVKQIGLGLAVAVLIDATLVRMVLVPAVMELLGKANWWLPGPLARVLPKTSLREDEPLTGDLALARTPE